jgi:predicted small lipoprotein YifL
MKPKARKVVLAVAVLAALGGCAYQDPLALPDLGPPAQSSHQSYPQSYSSYDPYYGYGSSYGTYGYSSGYQRGYDPYYNYYYGSGDSYYGPGVVYVPYPQYIPVPCGDANQDGRCDKRPRRNHDNDHDGDNDGRNDDGGKQDGIERWPRSQGGQGGGKGDGPRLRRDGGGVDRYVAPGASPRVAPPAVTLRPAPGSPSLTVPPMSRAPQARPADVQRRVAPPAPIDRGDRGPRVGPGRTPTTNVAGSPPRRPD